MNIKPNKLYRFKLRVFKQLLSDGYYTLDVNTIKPKENESGASLRDRRIAYVVNTLYILEKCGFVTYNMENKSIEYKISVSRITSSARKVSPEGSVDQIRNDFYFPIIKKVYKIRGTVN